MREREESRQNKSTDQGELSLSPSSQTAASVAPISMEHANIRPPVVPD